MHLRKKQKSITLTESKMCFVTHCSRKKTEENIDIQKHSLQNKLINIHYGSLNKTKY